MARPRNEQLKKRIIEVVKEQFYKRGYNETSYRSIAEECGISRALVQYHFPKKESLAEAFMTDILDECMDELNLTNSDLIENFEAIKSVGVLFFNKLLKNQGSRFFLQDVLQNRDMTENILAFNFEWALSHAIDNFESKTSDVNLRRNIVLHMGGFYELLYWSLCNNEQMDVELELSRVVDAFAEELLEK